MRKLSIITLVGLFLAMTLFSISSNVSHAQKADDKPDADRAKVANLIEKGETASAAKVMQEMQPKMQDYNHALQAPNFNVQYEEIKACGFYPQETRLECVIEIKRMFGYAGPVGSPGSIENVLFCVDWNNNGAFDQSEAVGIGSMAIHDDANTQPPWHYAVYRDFDPRGGVRTGNGGNVAPTVTSAPSLRARAILSWFVHPTGCNFVPVWGNGVNFRIRFDPVR